MSRIIIIEIKKEFYTILKYVFWVTVFFFYPDFRTWSIQALEN